MSKSRKTAGTKAPIRQPAKTSRRTDVSTPQKRQTKATSPVSKKASAPGTSMQRSKKAIIVALLQRPEGAPLSDLTGATGWQAHSVRAALTGLRKEGKELIRTSDAAGITHYRLAAAA